MYICVPHLFQFSIKLSVSFIYYKFKIINELNLTKSLANSDLPFP